MRKNILAALLMILTCAGTFTAADAQQGSAVQDPRPAMGSDEGLLKVTLQIPDGVTAPEKGFSFRINGEVKHPGAQSSYLSKLITMKKGISSYSCYFNVAAAGGKASCSVRYLPGVAPGFLAGYADKKGTSLVNTGFTVEVRKGEVQEVMLNAVEGVTVSGTLTLPASANPEKKITAIFWMQGNRYYNYTNSVYLQVADKNSRIPFSLTLPKNELFGVMVVDAFGSGTITQEYDVVNTVNAGAGIVKDISVKNPEKVLFSDAGFEKLVRTALKIPTGPIYDYMVSMVGSLTIDGQEVKSLADLPKMKSLAILSIRNFRKDQPGLTSIGGLKYLVRLEITQSEIPDLSFLKTLSRLMMLSLTNNTIPDIRPAKELTGLTILNLSNNNNGDSTAAAKPADARIAGTKTVPAAAGGSTAKPSDARTVADTKTVPAAGGGTAKPADVRTVPDTTTEPAAVNGGAAVASKGEKITFSDPEIENQVRASLGMPSGDITTSMTSSVTQLYVDGKKVKSLSDLSELKALRSLNINSFQNISPYLAAIGDLPELYELSISSTILPNLSFIRKLHLKSLILVYNNITDISEVAGQTGLTYLDIRRNRITDHSPLSKLKNPANVTITCSRNEDLSFMKDFDSLAALTIYGSYALKDFSFIKNMKNVKDISLYEVSPYSDLSFLLQMNGSCTVKTSLGSGKEALMLLISINESIRTILSKIIKPGMSDIEKELIIHDYVITNSDTGMGNKDLWAYNNQQTMAKYGEYFTLMTGYFRDVNASFRILMNAAGVECMALSGSVRGVSCSGVVVKIQGEYYLVDPNLDKDTCVGSSTRILYNHFNKSADMFRDNIHQWDEDFFPKCTSLTYRYIDIEERALNANPQKRAESRMVLVTGGSFKNTNSRFYGTKAAVADFWISNCEVTKKEWDDVMGTGTGGNDFPAAGLAWGDCIEYCNKRSVKEGLTPCYTIDGKTKNIIVNLKANGYRLPTNTEWEYAASGGSLSKSYLYSGSNNIGRVAVYKSPKTAVVGTRAPNELNIYDMSGNVWEWCWEADLYKGVPAAAENPGSMSHAVRGGGWVSEAEFCTLTQRQTDFPFFNTSVVGFRVARSK